MAVYIKEAATYLLNGSYPNEVRMKLIRMSSEKYAVIDSITEEWFMGSRTEMLHKLHMLGIEDLAIAYAVGDLIAKDHHVAHFGVNGTFLFSEPFTRSNAA